MKMTYLKRSNQQGNKNRKIILALFTCLALVFSLHLMFPSLYGNIVAPVASLVWRSESASVEGLGNTFTLVRSKYALILENKRLKQEIASRDSTALLVDILKAENEQLKMVLERKGDRKDVLGVILARPPVSFYDTLLIDIGIDKGVKEGNKVYVDGTILIGDVAEVLGNTSKISLFSTPGREVPVLIGSSTVEALAFGRGGGNFEVRIPADIHLEKGDSIILPQLRSHIFGIVGEIEVDSTNSLQTIFFKAPINIQEIRYVEVEIQS